MKFAITVLLFFSTFFYANAQQCNTLKINMLQPSSVGAGSDFTVELTFDKPEIQSFAVYRQIFPKGFVVKELKSENAEFSFEKQELHLTWIRLPREKHFTVSYKVILDSTVSGKFDLNGKFIYQYQNKSGTIYTQSDSITVTKKGNPVIFKDFSDNKVKNSGNNSNPENVKKDDNRENITNPDLNKKTVSDSVKTSQSVSCSRELPLVNNTTGEFIVTLKISKGNLTSSAKIAEIIPQGFEASEIDSKGASFLFVENRVLLNWNKLPAEEELTVKYLVVPIDKTNKTAPEIDGQMLYIAGGKVIPMIVKRLY